MHCIWMQFCEYIGLFLKKLKHIILAADYMKKNYSVNRAGLCTKFILRTENELF